MCIFKPVTFHHVAPCLILKPTTHPSFLPLPHYSRVVCYGDLGSQFPVLSASITDPPNHTNFQAWVMTLHNTDQSFIYKVHLLIKIEHEYAINVLALVNNLTILRTQMSQPYAVPHTSTTWTQKDEQISKIPEAPSPEKRC